MFVLIYLPRHPTIKTNFRQIDFVISSQDDCLPTMTHVDGRIKRLDLWMNIVFKMLSRLSDRKLEVNVNTDETRLCFHNMLFLLKAYSMLILTLVYLKIPILKLLSQQFVIPTCNLFVNHWDVCGKLCFFTSRVIGEKGITKGSFWRMFSFTFGVSRVVEYENRGFSFSFAWTKIYHKNDCF